MDQCKPDSRKRFKPMVGFDSWAVCCTNHLNWQGNLIRFIEMYQLKFA